MVGACMRVSGALRRGERAGREVVHVFGLGVRLRRPLRQHDGQLAQRAHLCVAVNRPRWRKQRSAFNLLQHRLQMLRVDAVMVDSNCKRRGLLKQLFPLD